MIIIVVILELTLPPWLIPVLAAGVPALVVLTVLICVGVVCFKCRRPKKASLPVSTLNGTLAAEIKHTESVR